jgi:acetyl-CoA carboxylase biotin carboxyl carrier protein
MQFTLDTVRHLAHLLRESGLHEIEVEDIDQRSGEPFRLALKRDASAITPKSAPSAATSASAPAASSAATNTTGASASEAGDAANRSGADSNRTTAASDAASIALALAETAGAPAVTTVTATAVGLFLRPTPPINEGDIVSAKQIVAVVESLKIPNEIAAGIAGRVVEFLVEEGHGVEYGQPLLTIAPQ